MNKYGRSFFVILVVVLSTACQLSNSSPALDVQLTADSLTNPPNIILFMADDLGYETIGAYGGESYSTPNIDRIAQEGMRFDHCYAQPMCTPSRVQLMTSIYNTRNYVRFGYLDEGQTTFAHLFKKAGYATCITGKWQLGKDKDSPRKFGFERHCLWQVTEGRTDGPNDKEGRDTRYSEPILQIDGEVKHFEVDDYGPHIVSDYGLDFITRANDSGRPFLLYYPMLLPHWPHCPTPSSEDWLQVDAVSDSKFGIASYFPGMIAEMDSMVGRIDRHLASLGIQDNTLLVFIGDNGTNQEIVSIANGIEIRGGKRTTLDAGTRVPMIAKWPAVIKKGTVSEELIDFTDFLPTMLEVAGLELIDNVGIDGVSFLPLLKSEKGQPRVWTYDWFSSHGEVEDAKVFARTKRFKLYENGNFFDIEADVLEERPLELEGLDEQILQSHRTLQEVISGYKARRLENVD